MNDLDFSFEASPWEAFLSGHGAGGHISGMQFLSLLAQEDDETLDDAFGQLLDRGCALDISDIPPGLGDGEADVRLRMEAELARGDDLTAGLEENDPLLLYLQELAAIPAFGDPAQLALQLAQEPTRQLRTRLVDLSLSRVLELAREYTGYGVLLLDLIQEGSLGLWEATATYSGGDFFAHRDWWIRQYLARAVVLQARAGSLGQRLRTAVEDYRSVDERLLSELGRNPTMEEIADAMHVSVQEAQLAARTLDSARMLNRCAPPEPEVPEQEEDTAVEDTAYFQTRQRIEAMLSGLDAQQRRLIELRFGLEGGRPLSPAETGRIMGLTAQEVTRLESSALAAMRPEIEKA